MLGCGCNCCLIMSSYSTWTLHSFTTILATTNHLEPWLFAVWSDVTLPECGCHIGLGSIILGLELPSHMPLQPHSLVQTCPVILHEEFIVLQPFGQPQPILEPWLFLVWSDVTLPECGCHKGVGSLILGLALPSHMPLQPHFSMQTCPVILHEHLIVYNHSGNHNPF